MDRIIKELEQQVEYLRERVGHWKRLAKEQRPRYTTLKESSSPITTSQQSILCWNNGRKICLSMKR